MGTAYSDFTATLGGDSYTFTSPNFRVRYSGDALTSLSNAFNEKSSLASIDKWTVDTSNVTDMTAMFQWCTSLASLGLGNFNTSAVYNMRYMFIGCSSLTSLDLSSFDTSKVTNMRSMFKSCLSLTELNISGFNTNAVYNMRYMLCDCYSLASLDVSSFNLSAVTDVGDMFNECSSLTDLQFGTNLKVSLDLSDCPLTHTSALSVLNGLATITDGQTITFKATTYSTLTAAEIKTATDKGWTITSA